jgi:23S rRNA (cytidine1920-2'-O)/16S rRNA (cytidine1409-2'-O)-methyltransferase
MVDRGLVESRSLAQRMIMAGTVRVDGELIMKASQKVERNAEINLDPGPKYISRAGVKLEAALDAFDLSVADRICADVGVSTGGFTDCLLQRGAKKVFAIDVGKGVIHWRLRNDHRIVLMESTNVRSLVNLPDPVSLVTIDVSFISLRLVLPVVSGWLEQDGDLIALVKPQFEAGRREVGKGGIVKDLRVHKRVLDDICRQAVAAGLAPRAAMAAPIRGQKGNQEYLLWCVQGGLPADISELLRRCFAPQDPAEGTGSA